MKCPKCGNTTHYIGARVVECSSAWCVHYVRVPDDDRAPWHYPTLCLPAEIREDVRKLRRAIALKGDGYSKFWDDIKDLVLNTMSDSAQEAWENEPSLE